MDAALSYLATLGDWVNHGEPLVPYRARLTCALDAIRAYEQVLSLEMLRVLQASGAEVYGIRDPGEVIQRVPTFCFNLRGISPAKVVGEMARNQIGVRAGHMYAPRLMRRLGLAHETGAVRASLVHYNTIEEVQRFGEVLRKLVTRQI